LKNKPNVIFASPGQEISGITDYRYLYTPDTARAYGGVFNQILMGFSKKQGNKTISEGVPGCIDVGIIGNKGEKIDVKQSFTINAPQEPGVYYVKFRSALQYGCKRDVMNHKSAMNKWKSGEYLILEQSNIGIVVVGNIFSFPYPEIWQAYSNNVLNQNTFTGDENANSGIYVVLRNFHFDKK
jgi:hypothetical protein